MFANARRDTYAGWPSYSARRKPFSFVTAGSSCSTCHTIHYYTKPPALHDGGKGAFSPHLPSQGPSDIKGPSILFTLHFDVLTFDFWLHEHRSPANSPKRVSMLQEQNCKVKRKSYLSHSCPISCISTKCGLYIISPGSGPKNCDTS